MFRKLKNIFFKFIIVILLLNLDLIYCYIFDIYFFFIDKIFKIFKKLVNGCYCLYNIFIL